MAKRGIFYQLERKRADEVRQRIIEQDWFTDVLSIDDFALSGPDIFLLSLDPGEINFAAVGKKGSRAATAKALVRFNRFVDMQSVTTKEVVAGIEKPFQKHAEPIFGSIGGRFPERTWESVWKALLNLRPQLTNDLNDLLSYRDNQGQRYESPAFQVVAQEKDALLLAARFIDFPVRQLVQTMPPLEEDSPAPFIRQLSAAKLLEDSMIVHDQHNFGDWIPWREWQTGVIELRHGNQKMTVVNANRTPIERTLGVDLLHYHHHYRSFASVQYKRMTVEESEGRKTMGFRLTDQQFLEELKRMNEYERNRRDRGFAGLIDYRLGMESFFFKLCGSVSLQPESTRPITGMYIPLTMMNMLRQAEEVQGPRGGARITFDNIGRYISNDLFVKLAQNGWIGTRLHEEGELTEIIQNSLEADRSAVIAIQESIEQEPANLDDCGFDTFDDKYDNDEFQYTI